MQDEGREAKGLGRYLLTILCSTIFVFLLAACELSAVEDVPSATPTPANVYITKPPSTSTLMVAPLLTRVPEDTATPTSITESVTPSPRETPEPIIYLVQEGDNLWTLAEEFGITVDMIQQANRLADASSIAIGQELLIPAREVEEGAEASSSAPIDYPQPELAVDAATTQEIRAMQPPQGTAPEETPIAPIERRMLHNGVLCPPEEHLGVEGGEVIGRSAVCRIPIVSYQLGNGTIPLILIGGIHGGYEWNTILLAYNLLDHLRQYPTLIPPSMVLYIVPNANPDGLYAVTYRIGRFALSDVVEDTIPGRFNGHNVDLNRNWDCEWAASAIWRNNQISGGSAPFSEPENQLLRDYILNLDPAATLFLHSAAKGVFASGCGDVDPDSWKLGNIYSEASGYPLYEKFFYYEVTGDAGDWLASQGIPSISVELTTHESLDWDANLAGLIALMNHLAVDLRQNESR